MHTETERQLTHFFFEPCQAYDALGQTQTSQNETTQQKHQTTRNATQQHVCSTPEKRLPPKTYVWHDKLCNTLFFSSFPTPRRTLSSTSGIGHTPPKKETRAKKEKEEEPPQSEEGTPSRHHSTIPAYIFFLTSEITVSFSSSVSQRRRE